MAFQSDVDAARAIWAATGDQQGPEGSLASEPVLLHAQDESTAARTTSGTPSPGSALALSTGTVRAMVSPAMSTSVRALVSPAMGTSRPSPVMTSLPLSTLRPPSVTWFPRGMAYGALRGPPLRPIRPPTLLRPVRPSELRPGGAFVPVPRDGPAQQGPIVTELIRGSHLGDRLHPDDAGRGLPFEGLLAAHFLHGLWL